MNKTVFFSLSFRNARSAKGTILLSLSHWAPALVRRVADKEHIEGWVYIGTDSEKRADWAKKLNDCTEESCFQERLIETAWQLRRPFARWVAELGRGVKDRELWWLSDLAEKNTADNDLFLHLCRIETVRNLLRQFPQRRMLLVVEDGILARELWRTLKDSGRPCRFVSSMATRRLWDWGVEYSMGLARWGAGMTRLALLWWAARPKRRPFDSLTYDPGKPRVLVHTCIDEKCLGPDGSFTDRYFTQLPAWIRSKGAEVVTVVWPFNFRRPLKEVFAWFRSCPEDFLIPEDFFRPMEYLKAAWKVFHLYQIPPSVLSFRGISVRELLRRVRIRQVSSPGRIRFLLYGLMIKRLHDLDYRIDYYLDMFENMANEKPVVLSLRRWYPSARLFGFQHATINPFLLKFTCDPDELRRDRAFFPDRIVTNGPLFSAILQRNGFPQEILVQGPALRFQYLLNPRDKDRSSGPQTVADGLLVLPLTIGLAAYMLKTMAQIVGKTDVRITVKAHPMVDTDRLLNHVGWPSLPDGMKWGYGDMAELIDGAAFVVGNATAAVFDAVLSQSPIVLIGEEGRLDFNPLSWWQNQCPMFRTLYKQPEIQKAIETILTMDQARREALVSFACSLLQRCFNIFDPNNLQELIKVN